MKRIVMTTTMCREYWKTAAVRTSLEAALQKARLCSALGSSDLRDV